MYRKNVNLFFGGVECVARFYFMMPFIIFKVNWI